MIARSTGSVASGAVDLMRRQGVGLDDAVARLALRLRPPPALDRPRQCPPGLAAARAPRERPSRDEAENDDAKRGRLLAGRQPRWPRADRPRRVARRRRFSRLLVDAVLSIGGFLVGRRVPCGWSTCSPHACAEPERQHRGGSSPSSPGSSLYFWYRYWLAGKTPGKALFGLRVVAGRLDPRADVSCRGAGAAFALSRAFPLVGFGGVVLGARHRALHDVIAGTAVVYDYDAPAAHLRFLCGTPRRRCPERRVNTHPRQGLSPPPGEAGPCPPGRSRHGDARGICARAPES